MERRTYLRALGAGGVAGLAGCLDDAMETVGLGDDGETVLGPPEQSRGDPEVAAYPVHGQEFPDFSLPDPLAEETITPEDFVGERAILMTFFFTSCPDGACPALLTRLRRVQEDAAENGYEDDVALLAMTFDPERDTADALEAYAVEQSVDHEADNWHFLRPETYEEAVDVVENDFGMQLERVEEGDGGGDHNESDDHDHGEYTFNHINLVLLANKDGLVERAYPQAGPRSQRSELGGDIGVIVDDTRTVAQAQPKSQE